MGRRGGGIGKGEAERGDGGRGREGRKRGEERQRCPEWATKTKENSVEARGQRQDDDEPMEKIQGHSEGQGETDMGAEMQTLELGEKDEESRGKSGTRGGLGVPSRSPGSPCWWWSPGRCWRQGRCSRCGLCWTLGLRSILTRCLCSARLRGSRGLCWTPGILWSPGSC